MTVFTSDPTASNSGNMFFGLLATALNGGVVPDETSIQPILPQVESALHPAWNDAGELG